MGLEGRDPVRMGRMPVETRIAVRPPDGTTFAQCMLDGFDVSKGGGLRLDVSIPFSRLHRASGSHEFGHQHGLSFCDRLGFAKRRIRRFTTKQRPSGVTSCCSAMGLR
jgi:hypothetical protein